MTLKDDFESAVARSKQLNEKPSNEVLLELYSLYKQSTEGDVHGEEPGMFDFVAKAKYEAWKKCRGTSADDAMQAYIELVDRLAAG
jgi:acyl-CoA-binding protein